MGINPLQSTEYATTTMSWSSFEAQPERRREGEVPSGTFVKALCANDGNVDIIVEVILCLYFGYSCALGGNCWACSIDADEADLPTRRNMDAISNTREKSLKPL